MLNCAHPQHVARFDPRQRHSGLERVDHIGPVLHHRLPVVKKVPAQYRRACPLEVLRDQLYYQHRMERAYGVMVLKDYGLVRRPNLARVIRFRITSTLLVSDGNSLPRCTFLSFKIRHYHVGIPLDLPIGTVLLT